MGFVTIEGSLMPSVELPRGVQRTVAVTDHVRNLVRIGAAVVVEGSLDDHASVPVIEEQVWTPGDSPILPELPDSAYPPGAVPLDPPRVATNTELSGRLDEIASRIGAPAKNAKREVWAAFLTSKGIDFPDGDEDAGEAWAGRDDLIIIWQQASGGS